MTYELFVYQDREGQWCARVALEPNGYVYLTHWDHLQLLDEVDRVVSQYFRAEKAARRLQDLDGVWGEA